MTTRARSAGMKQGLARAIDEVLEREVQAAYLDYPLWAWDGGDTSKDISRKVRDAVVVWLQEAGCQDVRGSRLEGRRQLRLPARWPTDPLRPYPYCYRGGQVTRDPDLGDNKCDRCAARAHWAIGDMSGPGLEYLTAWFACGRHLSAILTDADWSVDSVLISDCNEFRS
jgi:hypothetical protein